MVTARTPMGLPRSPQAAAVRMAPSTMSATTATGGRLRRVVPMPTAGACSSTTPTSTGTRMPRATAFPCVALRTKRSPPLAQAGGATQFCKRAMMASGWGGEEKKFFWETKDEDGRHIAN